MASTMDRNVHNALRTIFKRCVECPDESPSCPSCPDGQICSLTASSCDSCASAMCIGQSIDPGSASSSSKDDGPNVGAIAGGVVGGVAAIVIVTFLIWKFWLKGRRQQFQEEEWAEDEETQPPQHQQQQPEKRNSEFTMRRDARSSTHTVASLASTVLTRASNIIQIAYIPGVTNRSGPQSPGLLVPPVPPIPIATANSQPASPYSHNEQDQHFFVPDLRDSTYTGYSDDRSSLARTSIAPSLARSSMASTVYGNGAIVSPAPAQTVTRGKAAVVSVKSSNSNSPIGTPGATPPVPQIDHNKYSQEMRFQIPSSSDSSKLSPHNSTRSGTTMGKPTALTISKGKHVPARSPSNLSTSPALSASEEPDQPSRPNTSNSFLASDSDDSDSEVEHSRGRRSLLRSHSPADPQNRDSEVTDIADTPGMAQSPFSDMSRAISTPDQRAQRGSGLSIVLESHDDEPSSESAQGHRVSRARVPSPFSDEHAIDKRSP